MSQPGLATLNFFLAPREDLEQKETKGTKGRRGRCRNLSFKNFLLRSLRSLLFNGVAAEGRAGISAFPRSW